MAAINFEVKKIEKATKENCVVVDVKFDSNNTIYTYVRKNYGGYTIIDGCKVSFDEKTYSLKSVERVYETEGKRKRRGTSVDYNKGKKSSEKSKMK